MSVTNVVSKVARYGTSNPFSVHVIPALSDNYSYLVIDENSLEAMAVDPVEPNKVSSAIKSFKKNINLVAIATTHHHRSDHAGGNAELHKLFPQAQVYGFDERIPSVTKIVKDNDSFNVGNLKVKVIHNPCHTSGSITFVVQNPENDTPSSAFTGDTLFLGGCGRFFEGDARQMFDALYNKIGSLPRNTQLFVGHEYTIKNLEFAASLEEENQDVQDQLKKLSSELKANGTVTSVPGTLGIEWKTNPFLRARSPSIMKKTGKNDDIEVLQALRDMKNNFK